MTLGPSGTFACTDIAVLSLVEDLAPRAVRLRVSLVHPQETWPHPYCRALTTSGKAVPLTRTAARTLARWVIRAHPEIDWSSAHDLDLKAGTLAPAAAQES
jgi:hypothetical protein